jgi:RNA polymerase sigma factor, sigma-70 family
MKIPLKEYTHYSENDLVQACREVQAGARSMFYRRYAERILVLCLRYSGNREDAQELLTDVFVAAFERLHRFEYRGEGSVSAWLSRLAVNHCLMYLRKRKLQFEVLKEEHELYTGEDAAALAQLGAKELMALIHTLPQGYRTVFNLFVFEEMSHKEIAALLDISENTSKTQLHKARHFLQKQLMQEKKNVL